MAQDIAELIAEANGVTGSALHEPTRSLIGRLAAALAMQAQKIEEDTIQYFIMQVEVDAARKERDFQFERAQAVIIQSTYWKDRAEAAEARVRELEIIIASSR